MLGQLRLHHRDFGFSDPVTARPTAGGEDRRPVRCRRAGDFDNAPSPPASASSAPLTSPPTLSRPAANANGAPGLRELTSGAEQRRQYADGGIDPTLRRTPSPSTSRRSTMTPRLAPTGPSPCSGRQLHLHHRRLRLLRPSDSPASALLAVAVKNSTARGARRRPRRRQTRFAPRRQTRRRARQ